MYYVVKLQDESFVDPAAPSAHPSPPPGRPIQLIPTGRHAVRLQEGPSVREARGRGYAHPREVRLEPAPRDTSPGERGETSLCAFPVQKEPSRQKHERVVTSSVQLCRRESAHID